ncbi:MAG: hypothetical protein AAF547_21980, partial [Actinomycetota bacterium]
HDRAFLERVVTDALILDGGGSAARHPGGFAAWDQDRRAAGGKRATLGRPSGSEASPGGPSADRATGDGAGRRSKASSGRSSSTVGHLLRQTEKEMAKLERRKVTLEAELADAGDDHQALADLGAELAEVGSALTEVEERWIELAEEQEARG